MRPKVDLDPWREQITSWIKDDGLRHADVLEKLAHTAYLPISRATLARKLREWDVSTSGPTIPPPGPERDRLEDRARFFFTKLGLRDKRAAGALQREGHQIGVRALSDLRRDMGLYRRIPLEEQERAAAEIRETLRAEYRIGRINRYGRRHLASHMRRNYNTIGRDRIFDIAKEVNAHAARERHQKNKYRRGQVVLLGPDQKWSLDGHCKFEHWGIQLYGAIDAYSRQIVWLYVGIAGRIANSVLKQYLDTIEEVGYMPVILRTDRGGETRKVANLHWYLRRKMQEMSGDFERDPILFFRDCFRYGTSKQNQRIEAWWNQLLNSTLSQWLEYFEELNNVGDYCKQKISDRIAFLAIYMPIIRLESFEFVEQWNYHRIRSQKNRPYVKHGEPYMLYTHPEESGGRHCGIRVDPTVVQPFQEVLADADLEEYLPPTTLRWCQTTVSAAGFNWDEIIGLERDDTGVPLHRRAYETLVNATRDHFETDALPVLLECDKPYEKDDRYPVSDFQDKINELEELNQRAGNLIITERPNENFGEAEDWETINENLAQETDDTAVVMGTR